MAFRKGSLPENFAVKRQIGLAAKILQATLATSQSRH